jgi:hypothetical protein
MTDDTKHNEAVGYKHPPVATQFKPGVSGNPSGRPKTVRSLRAELLDELRQLVRFRDGDSEVEISKARAIAKSLVHAAAGGNLRATTALLAFFTKSLGDTDEPQSQEVTPEDAEIINAYESRELRRSNACDIDADNSPTTSHEERKTDMHDIDNFCATTFCRSPAKALRKLDGTILSGDPPWLPNDKLAFDADQPADRQRRRGI